MTEVTTPSRATPPQPKSKQQTSYHGNHSLVTDVGAANNMDKEKKIMLSFSVPESWHQAFKIAATNDHTTMVRVFYQLVNQKYGIPVPPKDDKSSKK